MFFRGWTLACPESAPPWLREARLWCLPCGRLLVGRRHRISNIVTAHPQRVIAVPFSNYRDSFSPETLAVLEARSTRPGMRSSQVVWTAISRQPEQPWLMQSFISHRKAKQILSG